MSTRGAYRSFKLVSQLQRACAHPYLPQCISRYCTEQRNLNAAYTVESKLSSVKTQPARLVPAEDSWRKGLLRTCAILSSAVYPAGVVVAHGVKKVKASGEWQKSKYRIEHLLPSLEVVDAVEEDNVCQPAYAVCIDKKAKVLYIVVRGSSSAEDFVTNMMCDPADGDLGPHQGMNFSAEYLDTRVRERTFAFISEHTDGSVVLTGHSLGAGTAALLCTRWMKDESMMNVTMRLQCIALACPAVFNEHDSYADNNQIKVIVFGKDIVPRLSFGSFRDLLIQMQALSKLEARDRPGVDAASTAISEMSVSTSADASRSSTPDSTLGRRKEVDDEEWKHLPERTDTPEKYAAISNVILTDVSFAGLTADERTAQNKTLAAQLKKCKVSFGGASFNQINGILKDRIKDLDKQRARLMRYPREAGLVKRKTLRILLLTFAFKIVKFFHCGVTTERINVNSVDEELLLLRSCLSELENLRCRGSTFRFFVPPGQIYLCVPKLHFLEQSLPLPKVKNTLLGQCYIFQVDRNEFIEQSILPVWSKGALHQHKMQCYLQALAPDTIRKFPLETNSIE